MNELQRLFTVLRTCIKWSGLEIAQDGIKITFDGMVRDASVGFPWNLTVSFVLAFEELSELSTIETLLVLLHKVAVERAESDANMELRLIYVKFKYFLCWYNQSKHDVDWDNKLHQKADETSKTFSNSTSLAHFSALCCLEKRFLC